MHIHMKKHLPEINSANTIHKKTNLPSTQGINLQSTDCHPRPTTGI